MSIFRPVLVAASLWVATFATAAADLRPDQKLLVDHLLAGMEPAMRASFRAEFERQASILTPEQVQATLRAAGIDPGAPPPALEGADEAVASAADADYHRAQYEPLYRKSWQAQRDYDALVEAELEAACPDPTEYTLVLGPDYYRVRPLQHQPLATWNVENDLMVLAGVAPHDGRYDFDFSAVKLTFDRDAARTGIADACAAWTVIATEFYGEAQALRSGDPRALSALERQYAARVTPVEEKLRAAIAAAGPSNNEALFIALLNGQPAR